MTATDTHTAAEAAGPAHRAEITVPLNRLKASPRNARKTRHSAETLEAFAASILAKGVLQPPVVEIERRADGEATGAYLVTIGEGRRQALRLLAKRKAIKRTHPVRVIVDTDNDAHEISLDENITREAMHPADQFEAFQRLAVERGYGPEEIAARFGVSAQVVRQRLRLAAAAPELIAAYREGRLALDQLTALCVSEDRERQLQVFGQVGPHTPAYAIRRAMTETKVSVGDRRAVFVGVAAYEAAGGTVLRDLFTEDGGGWLDDPALLDTLVQAKLTELADQTRVAEGWLWAEGGSDYGRVYDLGRIYPVEVARSDGEAAERAALSEEYDRLISATDAADMLPPEVDARLEELDKALQAFGPDFDYAPDAKARAGVLVYLGHDGLARFERGLVRPEDAVAPAPSEEEPSSSEEQEGGEGASRPPPGARGGDDEAEPGAAVLSDRMVLDLTAHRTMGLRDAVQADPDLALTTVVHALVLQVFYPWEGGSPLQLSLTQTDLERSAPGVEQGPAGRRVADRREAWGARLPENSAALWSVLAALRRSERLDLLALCAGFGLHAVHDRRVPRSSALAQAEVLATAAGLDMTTTWTATADAYFSRVSKGLILEAVREAAGTEEAERLAGLRKPEMAEAAERLVEGKAWLPPLLRTRPPETEADQEETATSNEDAYAFAAE